MKNLQKGFVAPLVAIIIGALIIGGGAYVYINKDKKQDESKAPVTTSTSDSSFITDFREVKDFDTCMNYAKNIPTTFDIVFAHGSDIQEIKSFGADFKKAYPRGQLEVFSEQDFLNEAIEYNGGSIKTAADMAEYKKGITAQASSKISITIPINDLGSLQNFSNFISTTLAKYTHIKFRQYAGSSPETTLSALSSHAEQKMEEDQCDYKYKKLSASDRSALNAKEIDGSIKIGVMVTSMNASSYYADHASYGSGPLSLNNGICSDTTVYGLKKSVDSVAKIAGSAYCYASSKEFAFSAPSKLDPKIGYCADSTGFSGTTTSPTAASKGYCVSPRKINQDISMCKNNGKTARERWICVGNIVDPFPPFHISSIVMPYATLVSQKIDFCKKFTGIEADYCYTSIVKAGYGLNVDGSPTAEAVCKMVSSQNPWFKSDCNSN